MDILSQYGVKNWGWPQPRILSWKFLLVFCLLDKTVKNLILFWHSDKEIFALIFSFQPYCSHWCVFDSINCHFLFLEDHTIDRSHFRVFNVFAHLPECPERAKRLTRTLKDLSVISSRHHCQDLIFAQLQMDFWLIFTCINICILHSMCPHYLQLHCVPK